MGLGLPDRMTSRLALAGATLTGGPPSQDTVEEARGRGPQPLGAIGRQDHAGGLPGGVKVDGIPVDDGLKEPLFLFIRLLEDPQGRQAGAAGVATRVMGLSTDTDEDGREVGDVAVHGFLEFRGVAAEGHRGEKDDEVCAGAGSGHLPGWIVLNALSGGLHPASKTPVAGSDGHRPQVEHAAGKATGGDLVGQGLEGRVGARLRASTPVEDDHIGLCPPHGVALLPAHRGFPHPEVEGLPRGFVGPSYVIGHRAVIPRKTAAGSVGTLMQAGSPEAKARSRAGPTSSRRSMRSP